jgi:hypothetical protein
MPRIARRVGEHPLLQRFRTYVRSRRHTALLLAIIASFLVRPMIGDTGAAPIIFSFSLIALMLVALFTTQIDDLVGERDVLLVQKKRRSIVAWVLAATAVVERVAATLVPDHRLFVVGSVGWLLFFAFVTVSELRRLLKQREVTGETISMSVSIYLLMGLTWGLLYGVIFQRHPDAFNFGGAEMTAALTDNQGRSFPVFIYFSLTTLSTLGLGDITPVSLQARYAAAAEGITGQFYMAILVARLVGMHMSRSPGHRE